MVTQRRWKSVSPEIGQTANVDPVRRPISDAVSTIFPDVGDGDDDLTCDASQTNCSISAASLCISLLAPPRYDEAPMRKSHKPMFLKAFA